jgi:hypothetical protein
VLLNFATGYLPVLAVVHHAPFRDEKVARPELLETV